MSEIRAGDADRDAAADTLRRAHAEGRLETSELEERLERCYAARTLGELARLVDDLPRPPRRARPGRARPPLVLAPLAVGLLALAVATHGHALLAVPFLVFVVFRLGRYRPRWR